MHIISEVNVVVLKGRNGLVGMANCIYNDALFLSSIGIMNKPTGGFRITFPNKVIGPNKEKSINIYHPINKQVAAIIEEAVMTKFFELARDYRD